MLHSEGPSKAEPRDSAPLGWVSRELFTQSFLCTGIVPGIHTALGTYHLNHFHQILRVILKRLKGELGLSDPTPPSRGARLCAKEPAWMGNRLRQAGGEQYGSHMSSLL